MVEEIGKDIKSLAQSIQASGTMAIGGVVIEFLV